jgi:hypothetical protein
MPNPNHPILATIPPDSERVLDELLQGDGISFAQAARLFPAGRSGKPTNPATCWRWHTQGVRLADGRKVYLEAARVGCKRMTTRAAVKRFLAAQQGQPADQPQGGDAARRPSDRGKAVEQARADLRKLGV